jgi:integrase/recombinase XerD
MDKGKNEVSLKYSKPSLSSSSQLSFQKLIQTSQESEWFFNYFNKNTKETYLQAIKQFMSFFDISKDDLCDVTQMHVIQFRDYLIKEKYENKSINTKMSALSSLFDKLVESQTLKTNPVKSVRRLKDKYDQVSSVYISQAMQQQMLITPDTSTLIGLRDKAILYVFFGTGCRISELCNLQIKDYRTDADTEGTYTILEFKLKGGRHNKMAISSNLKNVIDQFVSLSGHSENEEAPLFPSFSRRNRVNQLTRDLTRQAVFKIWNKYCPVANATPHSARATFTTNAFKRDLPLQDIQNTVGHRNPKTTLMYNKSEKSYRKSAALTAI